MYSTSCTITVALLYIIFEDKNLKPSGHPPNIDIPLELDTGTDITYLDIVLYDPLINAVRPFIIFVFFQSLDWSS